MEVFVRKLICAAPPLFSTVFSKMLRNQTSIIVMMTEAYSPTMSLK
jgi:hypothetical protein